MKFHGIHNIDHKKARRESRPKKVKRLPPGTWVPMSVAAFMLGCSKQTVHLLRLTHQVEAIKFPVGPLLVNVADLKK